MNYLTYLDFDLRIERSGDGYRAQVLAAPAGPASHTFNLPFSDIEVENYVLRMGRTRRGVRGINSSEASAARMLGARLFDAVFGNEVRGSFRSSMDEAERRGAGLRIRLRLADTPELADLPWEFLHNTALNGFLSLSIQTPVVPYLELARPIRPLAIAPPLRVLVMIASPRDYAPLNVEREWNKLRTAVAELERQGLVTLDRLQSPTLAELRRQLRRREYHIFQFVGHGAFNEDSQDGVLVLEDEDQRGRRVSSLDLGVLLHDHRSLRLAVLNACEGARGSREDPFAGTAQTLVQQGIPAVIAMQFEITDEAAITLAQEFYGALADNYPVDAALAEARKALFAEGHGVEWGTPVLYMHAPNGVLFDLQKGALTGQRQAQTEHPAQGQSAPEPAKLETATHQQLIAPQTVSPESLRTAEQDQRQLTDLYTQALSFFYTERWDQAIELLAHILSQQADYEDAAPKLEEARRQQKLVQLYTEARAVYESGSWVLAIESLETIAAIDADYKDAYIMLREARRQKSLADLYVEARGLHAIQSWRAVVNVFERIASLDAAYSDPEGLLESARQKIAAEEREKMLASLYSKGLHYVNTHAWDEAQKQFQEIQRLAPGYRETETLLQEIAQVTVPATKTRRFQQQSGNHVPILQKETMSADRARITPDNAGRITCMRTLTKHTKGVHSVAFAPDSQTLASGSGGFFKGDNTVRLWRAMSGKLLHILTGHTEQVSHVTFAPDGQILASAANDGSVLLWQVVNGKLIHTLTEQLSFAAHPIFSPDGRTLATTTLLDDAVRLWHTMDGKLLITMRGHTEAIMSMAFTLDGRVLASGSADNTVRLWRVNNGEIAHTLKGHTDWVACVAFAPNGRILASGSRDKTIRIWHVADGRLLHTLTGYAGVPDGIAFAPDGQTLAALAEDNTVYWWKTLDWKSTRTLQDRADGISRWALAPDGQTLVTGSVDHTLQLWNMANGKLLQTLMGHTNTVNSVAFSPDGTMLASGSDDHTVRLWAVK